MKTLLDKIRKAKDYFVSHRDKVPPGYVGGVSFNNADANILYKMLHSIEKEIIELEKIQNYNKEADSFNEPANREIKGKTPESAMEEAHEDKVNHPSHYTWLKDLCGIEVIDITRHMDFNLGNAIKYILRAGHKKEEGYSDKQKHVEDLQKAIFYLNDEIGRLES